MLLSIRVSRGFRFQLKFPEVKALGLVPVGRMELIA